MPVLKNIKLLALIMLIISCNNNSKTENDNVENDTIKNYDTGTSGKQESLSSCYESINGKDTVYLNVFDSSKIITGALNYHFNEKDNNNGTIRGIMNGDTLIADYIFMSEGKASMRQVAFLKRANGFIEGYGDVKEQDGKMVFTNVHELEFTGSVLHKIDCNMH
jgi:hypothetical protein